MFYIMVLILQPNIEIKLFTILILVFNKVNALIQRINVKTFINIIYTETCSNPMTYILEINTDCKLKSNNYIVLMLNKYFSSN